MIGQFEALYSMITLVFQMGQLTLKYCSISKFYSINDAEKSEGLDLG